MSDRSEAEIEQGGGVSWRMVECPHCGLESEEPSTKTGMTCARCNRTVVLE